MVSYWSLSDRKSPQISRTLLSIIIIIIIRVSFQHQLYLIVFFLLKLVAARLPSAPVYFK